MTTTARDITAELRKLYPRPVRLSVRDITLDQPQFLVRLPSAPACYIGGCDGLARYLSGKIGPVLVPSSRIVRRRDCGRDVEFCVQVQS